MDLDVDLVRPDHAQFEAGLFLDHFQAFAQVAQLGLDQRIARLGLLIRLLLLAQLGAQLHAASQAAFAEPELALDRDEEGGEDEREDFHEGRV